MTAQAEIVYVPVGRTKSGSNVTLCASGFAKIQAHAAKVQNRKAEKTVWTMHSECVPIHVPKQVVAQTSYIFARFTDAATGKTQRPELGRWLLGTTLPVAHKNRDPLDFRLENLEARESERQKKRRIAAQVKREAREAKAKKRAERLAKRKEQPPDGLTPDEQLAVLFDETFQAQLTRMAGAIVRDPLQKGTPLKPTDEKRGPEAVSMVIESAIQPIKNGQVRNVRAYVYACVMTQARKERAMRWYGMGHVRRPKAESRTLSDLEAKMEQEDAA